jgi:hypothetical protein
MTSSEIMPPDLIDIPIGMISKSTPSAHLLTQAFAQKTNK